MTALRTPVVMIHGAFCGGWVFDHWRAAFEAKGHRVHTPTLRYHDRGGDPPAELGKTSIRDYADDIEKLISDFPSPPILIGHSMGGLIAQMLAARTEVRALVLLAPSAPWGVLPSTPFEFVSAQALYLIGDFWNKRLWPTHWIAAANALDQLPSDERDAVFARFVPESGLATFEVMHWPLDFSRATQVDPRDVTCPVLCLVGAKDRVNPPATVRRVATRYGGRAIYEELAGHSHWLIGEPGWEKVATRALTWLAEVVTEKGRRAKVMP
jgi:pimeloyl-ACP methyl ester carboxylesterase